MISRRDVIIPRITPTHLNACSITAEDDVGENPAGSMTVCRRSTLLRVTLGARGADRIVGLEQPEKWMLDPMHYLCPA